VASVRDYLRALKGCGPGDTVKLRIRKPGGEPMVVSVILAEMP
jgi:hypothetical protein